MLTIIRNQKYHQYFNFANTTSPTPTGPGKTLRKDNSRITSDVFLKTFTRPWSPKAKVLKVL